MIIEKNGDDGDSKTIANMRAPLAVGITVFAPYLTLAAGVFALATGHQFRVKKIKQGKSSYT